MEIDLPYSAEYAKTDRCRCKSCKTQIAKGSLKLAAIVQSAFHDGKQANWFHERCFFLNQRPGSADDFANLENLRFEDQQKLEKLIVFEAKGKKRLKTESVPLKDFGIEYAKSERSACRGCEQIILKDELRIRKTIFDTEDGMKYGRQPLWHHIECFAQVRSELGWFDTGENLPGYKSLKPEDKEAVKKAIP